MKRKTEQVPEFDEIIFENRNKSYGAYLIRKRYNATTSISILIGVTLSTIILLAFSSNSEKIIANPDPVIVVAKLAPLIQPPDNPEPKTSSALAEVIKNVAPVVITDTSLNMNDLPTFDELIKTEVDKPITDTIPVISEGDQLVPNDPVIFTIVQEMPQFPGGDQELLKFIAGHIIYPEDARDVNLQGRVVIQFVVNKDGSVDRAHVLKGIDPALDNEAVRVVNSLPRFKPGRQNGVPVPVWFSVPILFRLETN
jgi:periplasmic protein TonB